MLTTDMIIVIAVLALYIVLMLSGKFSFPLCGITCIAILVLTGAVTLQEGFSGFTDKTVIMLAGMFPIAGQLGETSLTDKIKAKVLSAKGSSDKKLVLTLLVISAILAQFIPSQTSIIVIMMTFMLSMGNTGEVTLSRMLLPITHVLTTWMGKFPIGAFGVTTYLMLNQFIEASGSAQLLDIFSILKCTFIPAVVSIIYCTLTYKWLPKKDVDTSLYEDHKSVSEALKMSKRNENITYISFIVSVLALIFTNQIGDRAYIVPLATVVVMIYLRAMDGKKFLKVLMNGPVLMCATIVGIANAITSSGAGEVIGNSILSLLGGNPSPILIIITFAIVALIVTSFVSNTACFMVLVPIACNVCAVAGVDPRAVVVTIFYCSLLSLLTPMDSTGAALAYSSSGLGIRDTFKWAFPLAIIGVIVCIINCLIVYPM